MVADLALGKVVVVRMNLDGYHKWRVWRGCGIMNDEDGIGWDEWRRGRENRVNVLVNIIRLQNIRAH